MENAIKLCCQSYHYDFLRSKAPCYRTFHSLSLNGLCGKLSWCLSQVTSLRNVYYCVADRPLKLSILSRVSNVSPCNSQFDWGIESFCVVNEVSKICLKLVHGCKVSFLKMFSCREHFTIIQIFGATMKRIMLEEDRQCLTPKRPN